MSKPKPGLPTRTPPDDAARLATRNFLLNVGNPLNVDLILFYFGRGILGDPVNPMKAARAFIATQTVYNPRILRDLHQLMNEKVVYPDSKAKTTTHVGSPDNQAYRPWRVIAKELDAIAVDSTPRIRVAIKLLDYALYGVVNVWPLPGVPVITEADFSERFEMEVLEPCTRAINQFLRLWYIIYKGDDEPPVVSVRPQRYYYAADTDDPASTLARMFVDHVVVCKGMRRGLDNIPTEKNLVLVEEKKPGSLNLDDLKPFTKPDGHIVENATYNMSHHMSQTLKYVQRHECGFSMLCAPNIYAGMKWSELDQSTVRHPGENKGLDFWDMQPEGGLSCRLSLLHLYIHSLDENRFL